MEDNKITNTEDVVETNTNTDTTTTKTDEELFALLNKVLEKRETSLAKSVLKDNGMADDEIGEVISRYKASKQSAKTKEAEALSTLKTQNAALTQKLFNIELDTAAKTIAAEIGMDSEKLAYAMKLADTTKAVKDGNIDNAELKSALEKVLNDIPEFKAKTTEDPGNNSVRKVGVEDKDPETTDAISKMRKALGLPDEK